MDASDNDRLEALEKRIERITSIVATAVGIAAATLVSQITTKDWGWSNTFGGLAGGATFFAAFLLVVIEVKRSKK